MSKGTDSLVLLINISPKMLHMAALSSIYLFKYSFSNYVVVVVWVQWCGDVQYVGLSDGCVCVCAQGFLLYMLFLLVVLLLNYADSTKDTHQLRLHTRLENHLRTQHFNISRCLHTHTSDIPVHWEVYLFGGAWNQFLTYDCEICKSNNNTPETGSE